jgi:hypothetical protein
MSRALALSHPLRTVAGQLDPVDVARRLIVLGCAAALILAGTPLPI